MRRLFIYVVLVASALAPTAIATAAIHPAPSSTVTPRPMPTSSPTPWPAPPVGQAALLGRVVDPRGSAVSGATVTIRPSGVSTTTDVTGHYELRGITVGSERCVWMTIEVRKLGYGSFTTIDNPIEAAAYEGSFELRPDDRRRYIGPPRVALSQYPELSLYCPTGEWIAPRAPEDTSY